VSAILTSADLLLMTALLIRLVNDPIAQDCDFSFVKQFNTGAAPMPQEIVRKLEERFGHIAIRQAWGMTESTSALTLTAPAQQTYENAHTVGSVVPETVLKVVDPENGMEVEEGERGEVGLPKGLRVRGAC
jgi:4-coumarate--CoA ligase